MRGTSALSTMTSLSSWRLRLVCFDVRMCRLNARPRLIFPLAVFLKRLAAPLWVFIFGIVSSRFSVVSSQFSVLSSDFLVTSFRKFSSQNNQFPWLAAWLRCRAATENRLLRTDYRELVFKLFSAR